MTRARTTTKAKPKARAKAKPRQKPKNKKKQPMPMIAYEVIGLVLLGIAVLMVFQLGVIGKMFYNLAEFIGGYMAFLIPLALVYVAIYVMVKRKWPKPRLKVATGAGFILIGILLICHLIWAAGSILPITSANVISETIRHTQMTGTIWTTYLATGGGIVGAFLYALLHVLFDTAGTWIVAIILMSIGAIILTGKAAAPFIAEKIPSARPAIDSLMNRFQRNEPKKLRAPRKKSAPEQVLEINESLAYEEEEEEDLLYRPQPEEPIISAFTENVKPKQPEVQNVPAAETAAEPDTGDIQLMSTAEELENEEYQLPPLSLLTLPPHHDQSGEYSGIQKNAKKLEKTFQSFGVRAKVTQVHLGPAVTKYEVLPDTGVKVSKIVSLHDDLALALAARDIRIEAPIPGKSAIGIEVPNTEVSIVSLREVLESEENNRPDAKLLFALGRDVTGQAVMTELNKMPHLLVA
ncbi:MAG: cell division protein FtsK, partial [Planococcus sp. (in: Bacteria)]|nr:cell division protein FtsK [Planococcus sp. (in: firmicutes)]